MRCQQKRQPNDPSRRAHLPAVCRADRLRTQDLHRCGDSPVHSICDPSLPPLRTGGHTKTLGFGQFPALHDLRLGSGAHAVSGSRQQYLQCAPCECATRPISVGERHDSNCREAGHWAHGPVAKSCICGSRLQCSAVAPSGRLSSTLVAQASRDVNLHRLWGLACIRAHPVDRRMGAL